LPAACAFFLRAIICSGVPPGSRAAHVAQPDKPEPLTDVRGTDARRAKIGRPEGVARSFQVSRYSVEPAKSILARDLLSKDD